MNEGRLIRKIRFKCPWTYTYLRSTCHVYIYIYICVRARKQKIPIVYVPTYPPNLL